MIARAATVLSTSVAMVLAPVTVPASRTPDPPVSAMLRTVPPAQAGILTAELSRGPIRVAADDRGMRRDRRVPRRSVTGAPMRLRVAAVRHGRDGRAARVQVHLPSSGNDRRAWVAASQVRLVRERTLVVVSLGRRRLTVYRLVPQPGGRTARRAVADWPIGVGKRETPTPTGQFAITGIVATGTTDGVYGTHALATTAYSPKMPRNLGQVALHGTNQPQLLGPRMTRRVSHGCIRMTNKRVRRLARLAGPGTPLDITR